VSFLFIFFAVFFFLTFVVAPIAGAEDRPGWLRVNHKPRRQI
jgi:hypothetical protein